LLREPVEQPLPKDMVVLMVVLVRVVSLRLLDLLRQLIQITL
jgi:hypothetical protein